MRDPLNQPTPAPSGNRLFAAGERGRPDAPRDPLKDLAGGDPDAHGRQRARVCLSLLLAPTRDLPTHRRWA
jgi:hypothetical protein